jgi:ATP-binding protein involved in chromosome partitioning
LPQSYMLLVTTPQEAAAHVARRAAKMAEKVNMEVIGVIENMSFYQPAPDASPVYIFGQGGGATLANQLEVPLFAQIPLDPIIREGSDRGVPVVLSAPDTPAGQAFRQAAEALVAAIPVPVRA